MSDPITDLAREIIGDPNDVALRRRKAVVQSVQAGTVTIRLGGTPTDIPGVRFLGSYPPLAGETVEVVVDGPGLLIIGSVVTQMRQATAVITYVAGINGTYVTYNAAFPTATTNVVAVLGDNTGPTALTVKTFAAGSFSVIAFLPSGAEFGGGAIRVNYIAWGN